MHNISNLFSHYGYIVLLVGLLLELIAFPTPGEIMMSYCGYLVFQGKMNWAISVFVASVGTITGITISYYIGGKLGYPFFKKHGEYIHLGPDRLEKISKWFDKFGTSVISFAYFIPGVRHLTGYFSGISRIPFKKFASSAYLGAILWTTSFISLGKILGPKWDSFYGTLKKYFILGGIILFIILIAYYLIKTYKTKIIETTFKILNTGLHAFRSFGRIKIAIILIAAAFLGLTAFAIGLTQDFIGNEFTRLDVIVDFVVKSIYSEKWTLIMKVFEKSTSYIMIILMAVIMFIWITRNGIDKLLEIRFLLISIIGGEIFERILILAFHRKGPLGLAISGASGYTFPSTEAFMVIVTYGFFAFIIIRHARGTWVRTMGVTISIIISFFVGQSELFFQRQYPSDVVAGYVFGGVWLSLNIILLEIYRILPILRQRIIDTKRK